MKIYTSRYPPVPLVHESIFTNLFRTHFAAHPPDAPAYIDAATGFTLTRADTRDLSLALAYGLRHAFPSLGGVLLARGDVLMILSPNSIAWPVMMFGGWAAGLRLTLANSSYTPREIAYQWQDSGAKVVLVHPALLPVVLDAFKIIHIDPAEARRRIVIADWQLGDAPAVPAGFVHMAELLDKGQLSEEEKFPGEQAHETTLLCYSSGTTGKSKGVETTHFNLTTVLDMAAVLWPKLSSQNPRMLGILPFYHAYGAAKLIAFQLHRGIPLIIMEKFEPVAFCRAIHDYKITQACVVPPVCVILSKHPAVKQFNLTSLEWLFCAAAPLSHQLLLVVKDRLRSVGANVSLTQGWGLTETSPTATLLPAEDDLRKAGSVGLLLPNLEARMVAEDGSDAREGEPGEIWLRGPTIFKGYLNKPDVTRDSITPEGWFKTGDAGVRDSEGYYSIVDRLKELIKYKGFQVAPAELEGVLIEHPDVADAGVIGVYSEEEATELPRAYVVPVRTLTSAERASFVAAIDKWVKSKLARHKYLRGGVIVVDAIPKSPAGKILRRELREQAKAEIAEAPRAKL
ncbi:acyl--CoA ligase [Phanerochaete sordida]|uniref:Acyl--CoA ligase n=1 Tax=Phanerochaete sordida TaxID=48140 RepID=A0A9P3GAS4_9APHY|nr:acyl--CoA ligase [Phanerochaete sordida]